MRELTIGVDLVDVQEVESRRLPRSVTAECLASLYTREAAYARKAPARTAQRLGARFGSEGGDPQGPARQRHGGRVRKRLKWSVASTTAASLRSPVRRSRRRAGPALLLSHSALPIRATSWRLSSWANALDLQRAAPGWHGRVLLEDLVRERCARLAQTNRYERSLCSTPGSRLDPASLER